MAYLPYNKLQRVLRVQETYTRHKAEGISDAFIYRRHIRDTFHISLRTFHYYLCINARAELRKLGVAA